MSTAIAAPELTAAEQRELADYEVIIAEGMVAMGMALSRVQPMYIAMGEALQQVKDKNLYRAYGTWNDYGPKRWHLTGRRLNQIIKTARVGNRFPIFSEKQVRVIESQPPEIQQAVYDKVTANGETSTVAEVDEELDKLLEEMRAEEAQAEQLDKAEPKKKAKTWDQTRIDDKMEYHALGLMKWYGRCDKKKSRHSRHVLSKFARMVKLSPCKPS